ncbi:MAG: ABC-type antimicrobial peptide transport system, ATPase component [uncultured Thermomicrobiales bacterium]|uniref:ABC-type antimicrobial peptide transport system, ATPase component n=1 Tax=uncultured Thermomicrobiales bacterium TaxID=1645740 RepID=A0A6J4VIH8_9BACT|nr:MAG: ABC-type antimicrobial peptide transport system, ATPase component [uncultured Thermomicrobiales bacterium]
MPSFPWRRGRRPSNPASHPAAGQPRPPDAAAFIELTGVGKDYATGRGALAALRPVDLRLARGEAVAITGPSGSGKSTLLNLIAGIDRPTQGRITVDGADLTALSEERLTRWRGANVGIVFQFFQLMPTLSALENVALALEFRGGGGRGGGGRRARAAEALARVGLAPLADHLPAELSGGEQQRVALARALVNDPPLLLADEPTGNLDSATGERVMALLAEFAAGGRTLIFVTHDPALAAHAARTIRVRDGAIEADNRNEDARFAAPPAARLPEAVESAGADERRMPEQASI